MLTSRPQAWLLASVFWCAVLSCTSGAQPDKPDITYYSGACDASAAAFIAGKRFVVASDEAALKKNGKEGPNQLLIYKRSHRGLVEHVDVKELSEDDPDHPEADIEGAARVGDRIFWITSHGRNSSGKVRKTRLQLFASDVDGSMLKPAAFRYRQLLKDLDSSPHTKDLGLGALYDSGKPPEEGGVNIEGLAAGRKEGELLIAFRSPLVDGKALLVPLLNAQQLLSKDPPQAEFGMPILLELGPDRGFRDIARRAEQNDYVIIAGPSKSKGPTFQLFLWTGDPAAPPKPIAEHSIPPNFFPESLVVFPHGERIELLSDDGDCVFTGGGKAPDCVVPAADDEKKGNKHLPSKKRRFRGIGLDPGNPR